MCVLKPICIILPEISGHHLQLKCVWAAIFFPCHPYIESTTVLSDTASIKTRIYPQLSFTHFSFPDGSTSLNSITSGSSPS